MPKNPNIRKVLVIGSGPIVIGQAAEFDYAGTQACRVLKEEGVEVVLVNSNPATIMTDTDIADKVYLEPLTAGSLEKIIARERPDSLLASLGGQTGLNLRDQFAGVTVFDRLSEGKIVGKGFFNRRGCFIGRVGVFVDIFLNRFGGRFAAWRDKLHVAVVAQDDLPRVVLPENFFT